jgi:hypothetical protein
MLDIVDRGKNKIILVYESGAITYSSNIDI